MLHHQESFDALGQVGTVEDGEDVRCGMCQGLDVSSELN